MSLITQRIPELADAELARRVVAFLASRHLATLRSLEVEAQQGTVTLRGMVRTFYEKQLTQQLSRRVAGVVRLIDEIDVAVPARQPAQSAVIPIPSVVKDAAIGSAL